MGWGLDQFLKKKKKQSYGIKSLFLHFYREVYQYVNVTLLLLTGMHPCESLYFEEHLQTAASENMFMKLRKIGLYL